MVGAGSSVARPARAPGRLAYTRRVPRPTLPDVASLILHSEGGATHATLLDRHGGASAGWIPGAAVEGARELCARVDPRRWRGTRDPAEPLVVSQGAWRAAELAAARALAGLLTGAGLRDPRRGPGAAALVVGELGEPTLLPWELLRELPSHEAFGGREVLRRAPEALPAEATGAEERHGVEVRLYCPEPDDPVLGPLVEALAALLGGLPGVVCVRGGPGLPWQPGMRRVLHVCAHGRWVGAGRGVLLSQAGGSGAGPGELAASARAAGGVDLVLLDVCGAAGEDAEPALLPAPRLVLDGAPACLAWHTRAPAAGALAFGGSFYRALADGVGVHGAWVAGLGEQGSVPEAGEWPWARPWLRRAWLGSVDTWIEAAAPRQGLVTGLLAAGARERAVLDAAVEAAEGGGFLGVEHVAAALLGLAEGTVGAGRGGPDAALPWLRALAERLGSESGRITVEGWLPMSFRDRAPPRALSPSLRRLAASTPGPLGLGALTAAVFGHPDAAWMLTDEERRGLGRLGPPGTGGPAPAVGGATERAGQTEQSLHLPETRPPPPPFHPAAALPLEPLNGPHAGARVLVPAGAAFGRLDDRPAQVGLFPRECPFAVSVSRRVGAHRGGGLVELAPGVKVQRRGTAGDWEPLSGLVTLTAGELVRVGPRLTLRVGAEGAPPSG